MANENTKNRMDLFVVEESGSGEGKRSYWTKVGVAFENKDGSYSLLLSALPVSGRLQMRKPVDRQEREAA